MKTAAAIALSTLAWIGAATSSTAQADEDQYCVRLFSVRGWDYVDPRTIIIEERSDRKFRVTFEPPCRAPVIENTTRLLFNGYDFCEGGGFAFIRKRRRKICIVEHIELLPKDYGRHGTPAVHEPR